MKTAHGQQLPEVLIVATGGTIANSADGRMSVESVMADIPQLASVARITVHDYIRIGSSEISLQNWIDIAAVITDEIAKRPGLAGIVVTHGSNTAEETAYFLNLVLDTRLPVVITGAQRQRRTLSEDGSRNLYDAVRVAADPAAGGRGVLMVVGELIHTARDVTKTMSHRTETWDSGDLGALGFSDADRIRFYRHPDNLHTASSRLRLNGISSAADLPRVDVIYTYADASADLIEAAVRAGVRGLVIAGFPTGGTSPAMGAALERVRDSGIPVVMSHRGGKARIQTGREFISADNLTPQKARILLMLALANNIPVSGLQEVFLNY